MSKDQTTKPDTDHVADRNRSRELVRSDINLEKWSIFGTKESKGYRVLRREFNLPNGSRTTQVVKIGLQGSAQTLTAEEAKIFYVLLDRWDKSGRNPDGIVTGSFREIFSVLQGDDTKKARYGTWQKSWFKKKLDKLRTIPISFENSYHDKTSGEYSDKSFTLLTEVHMFERKKAGRGKQLYFETSTFVINKAIITSILNRQIKPILLNVITRLRHQISIILYRYLDLILADKQQVELRLDRLQEEFNFGAARRDNFLRQMREAAAELQGCDITTGRLVYCGIEKTADGRDWKLVVRKGKQIAAIATPKAAGPEDTFDQDLAAAQSFVAALDDDQQAEIESLRDQIVRDRYKSIGSELTAQSALIDAVNEFKVRPSVASHAR